MPLPAWWAITHSPSPQALPLVDGRPPDVAQIPQELQPNLITAAVAMGLQHAPVIEPGSDRLAHRWGCCILRVGLLCAACLQAHSLPLFVKHSCSSIIQAKPCLAGLQLALLCPAMNSQSIVLPAIHQHVFS